MEKNRQERRVQANTAAAKRFGNPMVAVALLVSGVLLFFYSSGWLQDLGPLISAWGIYMVGQLGGFYWGYLEGYDEALIDKVD